jgi:hypothetical protein
MKKHFFYLLILFATAFTACEKNYDLSGVSSLPAQPVVEGYIENGTPPYVILTNTFSLFGNLSAASVSNIFIHDATVKITSSKGEIFNLQEQKINFFGNNIYVYIPSSITDTGKLNTVYNLAITLKDGTKISAQTSILSAPKIDSIWGVARNTSPKDSLVRLYLRRHDNASTKDFYRYFTKTNSQQFLPGNAQGLISVFDDEYTNGITYEWPINRGIDRNDTSKNQFKHPFYFVKGDTVTVKLCAIDQSVYDFWLTADNAYGNVGNPFASPSNVKSNVTGALGVWCGYATVNPPNYYKIIIPK